jgi:protein TonB
MRSLATIRLSVSLLCAALVHGAFFGVAAVVLTREPLERPSPLPRVDVDVDVVEVASPRPEPIADAAPALVRAKLVAPASVHRHPHETAPGREVAVGNNPGAVDWAAADAPGPSEPAAPAVPGPPSVSRGPVASAPSVGAATAAEPRYRSNPRPDYPLPSLRRREEGVVLLDVVVQPNGIPAAITLNRSCGHPLLDRAALEAVRGWTFEPARAAGVPVSGAVVVPVRFSLSEGP